MAHIYFVRHGQTTWNIEYKICGATDIPLTELGHEQAIQLGKEVRKQGLQIFLQAIIFLRIFHKIPLFRKNDKKITSLFLAKILIK